MSSRRAAEVAAPVAALPPLHSGALATMLVSFFFGMCITYSRGAYNDSALVMALIGFLICIFAFVTMLKDALPAIPANRMIVGVVWAVLVGMLWNGWNDAEIIIYPVKPWSQGRAAMGISMVVLATYLPAIFLGKAEPVWLRWGRFALFAILLWVAGVDVIRTSPRPYIDTWTVQMGGADALLRGLNPFEVVKVKDTYDPNVPFVPYVYPPTQILLSLPGFIFGKDVRFSQLSCLVLAGFGLRFIVLRAKLELPTLLEDAPALFIWFTPKLFFIVEQSWVDPVHVFLFVAVCVAFTLKRPVLTAVLLGITFTSKQTMFWLIPIFGLCFGFNRKQWIITGAVGAAMVLPFAIWNFEALKFANFGFVSGLPHRHDALSFNNWGNRKFGWLLPGSAGFLLALVPFGLAVWKLRKPWQVGIGLTMTFAVFFMFNKWCFANYYFLLASLAAIASAMAMHAYARGAVAVSAETPASAKAA